MKPGPIQDPAGVQNGSQSISNRRWVRDGGWERKPESGESTAYIQEGEGGGAEPPRLRWEQESLVRQVKKAEQSDRLETGNTIKV